jgi:hypothetical protein
VRVLQMSCQRVPELLRVAQDVCMRTAFDCCTDIILRRQNTQRPGEKQTCTRAQAMLSIRLLYTDRHSRFVPTSGAMTHVHGCLHMACCTKGYQWLNCGTKTPLTADQNLSPAATAADGSSPCSVAVLNLCRSPVAQADGCSTGQTAGNTVAIRRAGAAVECPEIARTQSAGPRQPRPARTDSQ